MTYTIADTVTRDDLKVMEQFTGSGIRRAMSHVRRKGLLRGAQGVRLADVDGRYVNVFMVAAIRAHEIRKADIGANDPLRVWEYLRAKLPLCRKNARARNIEFGLSMDDVATLHARAEGRCEVTGVPFTFEKFDSRRSPFAPSFDRIDSSGGYTLANVRLVCQMVNLAMNVWGDRVMVEFIARMNAKNAG